MIEHRYVKKRKRRKLVALFSSLATLGMAAFVLVAFLGNFSGSFTVSLNKGNVKISLSDKQNFGDSVGEDGEAEGEVGQVGSYLKVDNLKPFDQMTFTSLPKHELIDTEETTWAIGENSSKTMNFFKYTFYVKNIGSISAYYDLKVVINESNPAADGRRLDSLLRVMFYANNGYDKNAHDYKVYAMASESPNIDENGQATYQEYISLSPAQAKAQGTEFPGYATPFESESVVVTIPVRYFDYSNMNRYTIVTWIEGYDPQSSGQEAPEGASIKLGVEINASENE